MGLGAAVAATPTGDTGVVAHTGEPAAEHTGVPGHTGGHSGPDPDTDADGDGWSLGEDDCNDEDALVNPGQPDVCFDLVDNDCSSLVDEGCDNAARLGSLGGGGACTGGANIAGTQTALILPGLFWLTRRRRVRT